jgi:Chaperone of endosialidase
MDKASEALFALEPVTFRYKKEVDRARAISFGLIAEEVAETSPELVTRDKEGIPETVRYDHVNAMLLNGFLKEHCKNKEQEATIAELKCETNALAAMVNEQALQLQRVSAQLELTRSEPKVAAENP